MKIKYIAIEREYGSGGSEIARCLSEQTAVPCYGREILEQVAKQREVSIEEIEHYEESVSNSFLYSVFVMSKAAAGDSDLLMEEGHIFVAEQAVIRNFANHGNGIFIGHCASEALKDYDGVLRVFIRCTDEEACLDRIVNHYGIEAVNAEVIRRKFNKKRSNYYCANTAKKWDDLHNYDLVLDSGVLGIDGCVAVLKGLFA